MQRIVHVATSHGLVLDSFAGSRHNQLWPTRWAVKWIMVELGEHCRTHIIPRMKKVIDGQRSGGRHRGDRMEGAVDSLSKLAPSLLERTRSTTGSSASGTTRRCWPGAVQVGGFTYAPARPSTGNAATDRPGRDFLYVTTQTLARSTRRLGRSVGENRSLLVLCFAFRAGSLEFPNLTVKKIPKAVLDRCSGNRTTTARRSKNLPMADSVEPVDDGGRPCRPTPKPTPAVAERSPATIPRACSDGSQ